MISEKDLKKTLEIAHKIISNNLFEDIKIIDLRIENHVITKKWVKKMFINRYELPRYI